MPKTKYQDISFSDAAADIVSEHGEDGASHYMHTENGWRPISRLAYDALVEIGKDVRLMRVEVR